MIVVKDVTTISSCKGKLLLHTDSGVNIFISCTDTPGYVSLIPFLDNEENTISIDVAIDWDNKGNKLC